MTTAVTLSDVDVYGKLVPIQGNLPNGLPYGLNLGAGTWGNNEVRASNNVAIEADSVLFLGQILSAGALTLKLSIFNTGGSPNFGAPDLTLSAADTNKHIDYIRVPAGKSFAVQGTAGAAGATQTTGFVLPINSKPAGKDMRALSASWNLADDGHFIDTLFAIAP